MKKTLIKKVRESLREYTEWYERAWQRAEEARRQGDTERFLQSKSEGTRHLGDQYWLLGDLEAAAQWYRTHAEIRVEEHRWFPVHDPSYPIEVDLTGDAEAMVKAGLLPEAREFLLRARDKQLARGEKLDVNDMMRIGIAGAQIGYAELVPSIQYYVDGQQSRFDRMGQKRREAIALLVHHPWAQASFLSGDYQACREHLARVLEAEERVATQKVKIYDYSAGSKDVFAMAHGLEAIIEMATNEGDRGRLLRIAEEQIDNSISVALGHTYDYEIYLRRLYLYMAEDIAEGRRPNPNPFAARG